MRWLRISAWTAGTFTALYHIAVSIAVFVLTTPRSGQTWFSAITTEDYQKFLTFLVPAHTIGLALDLVILALPIIAVSQLQMPVRRKIGIYVIFMTGVM